MTKRKASVALDSINETQSNSLKLSANNNGPQEACNRNNIGNNNNNVVVHQQNGTSSSQSMGNGDNNNNNCHLQQEQVDTASNNQNDNSVESNASSGNTSAAGCGGGGQHKSKKERADNWSNAEIQILHKGIESRRDVFYGPPSQATKKNRELAWEAITREVNAVSTTPRSLSQVMKKFKNEKCRAKRKFTDLDKDGHHTNSNNSGAGSNSTSGAGNNSSNSNNNLNSNNNVSNSNQGNNSSTNATNNINTDDTSSSLNLSSQQQQQQQQQHQHQQQQQQQQLQHHMTGADSMSAHINVVKLAPQNVAKTMIDLPGHVQQIQMPNDDMVLIVPPDMDGLLSGVNIVSDGNGHHHFQKCSGSSALNNLSHNHQNQHPLQTLNTNQSLVNGAMGSAMMSRTIPTGGVCSLVYSTSNELCAPDHHHVTQSVVGQASLATNHLGLGTRNLTHPRGTIIQTQGQQSHHHHMHQHQQQQQQQQPQPQPQPQPQTQPQPQHQQSQQQQSQQHQLPQQQSQHQPHPSQLANSHNQQQIPQNHLTTTAITNPGGVAVESQLKNLLLNLLLKEGPAASVPLLSTNTQDNKHRNDMLAIIASSLTKIESHLGKISKVASTLIAHNSLSLVDNNNESALTNQIHNSGTSGLNLGGSNGNNNNVSMSTSAATIRRDNE